MSSLNLTENLFIGVQELNMMQQFNNFTKLLGLMTKNYGFLENKDLNNLMKISDEERNCFKLTAPAPLQLQFFSPSYAFAYPNNVITWDKDRIIFLNDDFKGKSWWVKISYAQDSIERGTLQIDKDGNVTGTGTLFTQKLRGEPNFPSRVKLYTYSVNNFEEKGVYFVDSIKNNTEMTLYSPTGIGDISLTYYYSVLGTFPQGSYVNTSDESPFIYDSCKVDFIEDNTGGDIPNEYVMRNSNTEFYVARITVPNEDSGSIEVEDQRFCFESSNEENNRYSKWFSLK